MGQRREGKASQVRRRAVRLPSALTLSAPLLLGVLFGGLGLTFATPITACALVLVQTLYVEDTLGDSFETPVGQITMESDDGPAAERRASRRAPATRGR